MKKVSWLILTFNRAKTVEKAFQHNFENTGFTDYEIIHVDNGSTEEIPNLMADVHVQNHMNRGVPTGYNQAMQMARGEYLVITGCDMLMPRDWMKIMVDYMDQIPGIGVISLYSAPLSQCPERVRGEVTEIAGLPIVRAMPMGRRMMRRDLLEKVGYLREDFGMYGHDDVEWGYRQERVFAELGIGYFAIPHLVATHLREDDQFMQVEGMTYRAWKDLQVNDTRKLSLMRWCKDNNYPIYFP